MADSIHTGHRKRAKEEFLARGLTGMADHKVLELLLYYAIPQGDVNPLAHALIDRFGSLPGVFHATYEQLLTVKGVGPNVATLLKLLPAVAARYLEDNTSLEGVISDSWQVRDILMPLFFGARNEMFYILCMDGKNKVLACRKIGEGIHNSVVVSGRKVVEEALACNAARVILSHNHISGIAMYSGQDLTTTRELRHLLAQVGVELIDHVIIANDEMVSMRESGVLPE